MLDLSAIEKRCHEASAGPWTVDDITTEVLEEYQQHFWENCPYGCADGDCEGHYEERACLVEGIAHVPSAPDAEYWYFSLPDAEFVAHAREDIPALVARVRDLEKALKMAEARNQRHGYNIVPPGEGHRAQVVPNDNTVKLPQGRWRNESDEDSLG